MFIQPASFRCSASAVQRGVRAQGRTKHFRSLQIQWFPRCKSHDGCRPQLSWKAGQVAVTITIAEGSQWLVEHLSSEGIAQANRAEIMRQLTSIAGEPFSESNLAADRDAVLTWYYEHGFPPPLSRRRGAEPDARSRRCVLYGDGGQPAVRPRSADIGPSHHASEAC